MGTKERFAVKNCTVFVAALFGVCVFTGCGTPKVETLVDGMYDTKVANGKCAVVLDVDVAAEYDGEEVAAKVNADLNIDMHDTDAKSMTAVVTGNVNYDIMDGMIGDKVKLEAYITSKEDEQVVYFKDPESCDYYYIIDPIEEEVGAELSEKDIKKIQDAGKELWYKAEVGKSIEEVGGEKCYVLTLTPSGEDYMELMGTVSQIMDMDDDWNDVVKGLSDEYDIGLADVLNNANIQFTAYVSQKNKYMVGVEVDMSGIDIDGMFDVLGDALDDMDIDPDDIEVEINALSFSMIMSDIGSTEVEIPKKVIKNAIEYGASSDVSFFEDEYSDEVDFVEIDSDDKDDMEVQEWHPSGNSDDDIEYIEGYYDENTGKFMLCNYYDTPLYTFMIPDGYSMAYNEEAGQYYNLRAKVYDIDNPDSESSDAYYIFISDSALRLESEYIVNGNPPDEMIATDFKCEYTEFEIDGVELVKTYASYVSRYGDGEVTEKYGVGIKYIDYWGDIAYIGIDITKEMYDDWDNTLDVICEMLQLER